MKTQQIQALMYRNEARVGAYVEATKVEGLDHLFAMVDALGEFMVTWVQHKLFDTREMVLVNLISSD